MKDIFSYNSDDFNIINYRYHEPIKAQLLSDMKSVALHIVIAVSSNRVIGKKEDSMAFARGFTDV